MKLSRTNMADAALQQHHGGVYGENSHQDGATERMVKGEKAKDENKVRLGPARLAPWVLLLALASTAQAQTTRTAQIHAATAPLPEEFRETASVLGYETGKSGLVTLRHGNGAFICLADDPTDERFHVACYHKDLEPFMARGRELRAQKVTNVDSARYAEIDAKKLSMPLHPSALYSLTGKAENVNANGEITGANRLYVVYIPFATSQSTGLPEKPAQNVPWIMFPGTAKAHIMFVPGM